MAQYTVFPSKGGPSTAQQRRRNRPEVNYNTRESLDYDCATRPNHSLPLQSISSPPSSSTSSNTALPSQHQPKKTMHLPSPAASPVFVKRKISMLESASELSSSSTSQPYKRFKADESASALSSPIARWEPPPPFRHSESSIYGIVHDIIRVARDGRLNDTDLSAMTAFDSKSSTPRPRSPHPAAAISVDPVTNPFLDALTRPSADLLSGIPPSLPNSVMGSSSAASNPQFTSAPSSQNLTLTLRRRSGTKDQDQGRSAAPLRRGQCHETDKGKDKDDCDQAGPSTTESESRSATPVPCLSAHRTFSFADIDDMVRASNDQAFDLEQRAAEFVEEARRLRAQGWQLGRLKEFVVGGRDVVDGAAVPRSRRVKRESEGGVM